MHSQIFTSRVPRGDDRLLYRSEHQVRTVSLTAQGQIRAQTDAYVLGGSVAPPVRLHFFHCCCGAGGGNGCGGFFLFFVVCCAVYVPVCPVYLEKSHSHALTTPHPLLENDICMPSVCYCAPIVD
jgi:hypothetical protein